MSAMTDLPALFDDLADEGADLDALVAGLDAAAWATPTPAAGWTIAHQVAHLAWTDEMSLLAVEHEDAFRDGLERLMSDPAAAGSLVDDGAAEGATAPPAELLARWRAGRDGLVAALRRVAPGRKLAWFGPPMSAASMATARIMETWAHGLDVADALGVTREPTRRLRHVAHIGVRARGYSYAAHGLTPPDSEIRVELAAPDGSTWTWGPDDAAERVTGPALDFCLLVTRRRHLEDLTLSATGDDARTWLGIAQAFAGPPGEGRRPSGRPGG